MLISWRVYRYICHFFGGWGETYLFEMAFCGFQDNDICSLMMKRVYDIAASTSKQIKVWKREEVWGEEVWLIFMLNVLS